MAGPGITLKELKSKFNLSQDLLDEEVSEENLKEAASKIIADHELFSLGEELRLSQEEMAAISLEKKLALQRSAVLRKWKQRFAYKATYSVLLEALLKIGRADCATDTCKLLTQRASSEQRNASALHSSPIPVNDTRSGGRPGEQWTPSSLHTPPQSPPKTAEHGCREKKQLPGQIVNVAMVTQGQVEDEEDTSQLQQKVKQNMEHLEKKFEDLLGAASDNLNKRKVPIQQIRRSLFVRRATDTQSDMDLVAGLRHEIRDSDTVDDLFDILLAKKCWDSLNPGLLMRIIVDHCSESQSIQDDKRKYLEELQQFRRETTARQFAKVCNVSTLSPKFSEVIFEMDKDWDGTLEDVEELKQNMICGRGNLSFQRSHSSSLSLVWAFPRSCPTSTTILRIPPSFYLEHGIRRVLVKGVCVVDVKFEEEQEEMVANQLRKAIEVIASTGNIHTEELKNELKATKEENEELIAALKQAKTIQQKLEDKVKKYEPQMKTAGPTWRSVHDAPLLYAMKQKKVLHLTKEAETLKKLSKEDILMLQHEDKEKELLQVLKIMKGVEGRKPTPPTGDHFVESRGIRYNKERGGVGGNMGEVMILVSLGSEFPADVQVQPRVRDPALAKKAIQTHGRLPPIVTGLHEEAAADLMATVSLRLQDCSNDLVHLRLDVPGKQRPKGYYLEIIEEFFKHCQQSQAILYYLGHSDKDTGNWCFKDGTISFQEIFDLHRQLCPGKVLIIHSDCCYSGKWVRDCAETLDSLEILPCGHKAREQGILVKVYASCQPDQKAAEPCYSVEGVKVEKDRTLTFFRKKLSAHQTTLLSDATRLVCYRGPDESCRSEEALKNWTWHKALDGRLRRRLFIVRGTDRGRPAWHYVLLSNESEEYKEQFLQTVKSGHLNIAEWGYIIKSGWGENPPDYLRKNLSNWMRV